MKNRLFTVIFIFALSFTSACFFDSKQDNPYDPVNIADKQIISFEFLASQNSVLTTDATGIITGTTIEVTVPYDTDVTSLVATFSITGVAVTIGSITQTSGITSNDYTNTVTYTVTGVDGSPRDYTVTVIIAANTDKDINEFKITAALNSGSGVSVDCIGSISGTDISVIVPYVTNLDSLVATFSITGASVSVGSTVQSSNVTANNFNNPVTYTVKAADNSIKSYVVTVTRDNVKWARTVTGGSNSSSFSSVVVDTSGNVYAVGSISGTSTITFGTGVTATGVSAGNSVVLVKYNSSGTAQWARTVTGGTESSSFSSVAVDSSGNVYAAGYIYGTSTYTFGTGVTAAGTYSSGYSLILVKYNSSGTAQWARTETGGTGSSSFSSVAVDSSGNVYAAGFIWGTSTYTFNTGIIAVGIASSTNLVLVKYNSLGAAQWARTVTTGSSSSFSSVGVDSDGNIYTTGQISGVYDYRYDTTYPATYTFGEGVTAVANGSESVIVKYNSSGNAQWARTAPSGSFFSSVAFDSTGNIYTAGSIKCGYEFPSYTIPYSLTYDFGAGVTAIANLPQTVLVKYNTSGTAQWARTVTGDAGSSSFSSVAVDSIGNIYTAGNFVGTSVFEIGTGVFVTGVTGGSNCLLIKY